MRPSAPRPPRPTSRAGATTGTEPSHLNTAPASPPRRVLRRRPTNALSDGHIARLTATGLDGDVRRGEPSPRHRPATSTKYMRRPRRQPRNRRSVRPRLAPALHRPARPGSARSTSPRSLPDGDTTAARRMDARRGRITPLTPSLPQARPHTRPEREPPWSTRQPPPCYRRANTRNTLRHTPTTARIALTTLPPVLNSRIAPRLHPHIDDRHGSSVRLSRRTGSAFGALGNSVTQRRNSRTADIGLSRSTQPLMRWTPPVWASGCCRRGRRLTRNR